MSVEILKKSFKKSGSTGVAVQLLKRGVDTPEIRFAARKHKFGRTAFKGLLGSRQFGQTTEQLAEVTAKEGWQMRLAVYRTPDGKRNIAGFHSQLHWGLAMEQIGKIPEDMIPLVTSIEDHTRAGLLPNSGGGSSHASGGYLVVNGKRFEGGSHSGTNDGYSAMAYAKALQQAVAELYREGFGISSL
jgi:hypothetical protein